MEDDIFLKRIKINKVRHLQDIEIFISDKQKKHLIITGINGSGKTSLVEALSKYLFRSYFQNINIDSYLENRINYEKNLRRLEEQLNKVNTDKEKGRLHTQINDLKRAIENMNIEIDKYSDIEIEINNGYKINELITSGNFIIDFEQYFRKNEQKDVKGPQEIKFKKAYNPDETISNLFAQFLTNQRMDMLDEKEEKNNETYNKIKEWFSNLESMLKDIFKDESLTLKYNKTRRIFEISQKDREPFAFHEMSSGYAAYLKMIAELLMRMNIVTGGSYNLPGICIIDEIETHLHIDLQRKSLPLLTKFFPNMQFIITTHSPFIINSVKDSVVYDLENKILLDDDPTKFSADTILQLYFRSDFLSDEIKRKLENLNRIAEKSKPTKEDKKNWKELINYFNSIKPFLQEDVETSLTSIKIKSFLKDD